MLFFSKATWNLAFMTFRQTCDCIVVLDFIVLFSNGTLFQLISQSCGQCFALKNVIDQ